MASMVEHEASMTLYFYKSDGTIYSYCTGVQDMSGFGERAADYELIMDFIVVPKDPTVMEFTNRFYVDIESRQLKLKADSADFTKYL